MMTCLLVLTLGTFQRDRGTHTLLQLLCEDAGEMEREILRLPAPVPTSHHGREAAGSSGTE
jgi:hypothetical protein